MKWFADWPACRWVVVVQLVPGIGLAAVSVLVFASDTAADLPGWANRCLDTAVTVDKSVVTYFGIAVIVGRFAVSCFDIAAAVVCCFAAGHRWSVYSTDTSLPKP